MPKAKAARPAKITVKPAIREELLEYHQLDRSRKAISGSERTREVLGLYDRQDVERPFWASGRIAIALERRNTMVVDKRSLHLKLQEYCDCYMDTDPKKELDLISKEGPSADVTGDPEEVALKFLGLAILYGIKEKAQKISFVKTDAGEMMFNVEAAGRYKLPAPPPSMADEIFTVMRSITHLESPKAKEPLSLGLRNDQIELGVEFDTVQGKQVLTISFPEL